MRHILQATIRLRTLTPAALLAFTCGAMALLPRMVLGQGEQSDSVLMRHGRLKLQSYSIHGPAPLIIILTEAPGHVSGPERSYRTKFTDLLTRYIAMHGFSYFVLVDSVDRNSMLSTRERTLDRLEAAAREVTAALWRKRVPPAAYVGLAEGAVVAARLVTEDSLPRRLAALAPSLPAEAGKGPPRWEEVIRALDSGLPLLLGIQSLCDGAMPETLMSAGPRPQRLLLLPNYDSWLGYMRGTSCPGNRQVGQVPSLNVAQMVAEWLSTSVRFPQ